MADEMTHETPQPAEGLDDAVRSLTSTDGEFLASTHYSSPVMDAMSVIGSALGQPVRPPHPQVERDLGDVDAVITSSGWLASRVQLSGRWYSRVGGPLLVRRHGEPASVIPHPGRARLIASPDRTVTALTSVTANDVASAALAFAVDLPAHTGWLALIRWSLTRQRRESLLFVALAAIGGFAGLLLPLTTQAVFETAIPSGEEDVALGLLLAFAVASLGLAIVALARGYLVVRMRDRMDDVLAPGVRARLLRLKAPFFRTQSVGDLTNRAMSIESAREQVDDAVISTLVMSVFGLVSLAYLFTAGLAIGLVTTLAVLVVLSLLVLVQWRARKQLPRLLDRRSRTDALLLSLLAGLVTWRVGNAEDRALAEWSRRQGASTAALRDRVGAVSMGPPIEVAGPTMVLFVFTCATVLMPGDLLVPDTTSAPGVFLAMYAAIVQVTIAMLALSGSLLSLSEYGPVLSRLQPILTSPVEGALVGAHPGPLQGRISASHVTFGYDARHSPLFRDLSFDISPGEFVAFVGPSGGGKSTVLRLLLGFEEPWSGSIAYDGRDLSMLDVAAVRRQIGVVLQSSRPLGRTVLECVAGPRELSPERVQRLLEEAGLADDVAAMRDGIHTDIGEHGSRLSGGQRQRLMIAAALATDPSILFFDEATSALDNISQATVMDTILTSRATRVVIAHRLSTIERADRILVVSAGAIVEEGAPEDLLRAGGEFARLAARQEL